MIAFALVLMLASAAGWIAAKGVPARARAYLRLASALYAVLGAATLLIRILEGRVALPDLAGPAVVSMSDLVATLGPVVLCAAAYSAFRKSPDVLSASLVLGLAAVFGLAAALGFHALAAVPQIASALVTFLLARSGLWSRSHLYLVLAAFSMLGSAACQLATGLAAEAGVLLFEAAALIGVAIASNVLVEERQQRKRALAIGGSR